MNIVYFKYFIENYEQKSINKAAQNLFITPQGLSKALGSIESELNIRLIDRQHRTLSFTMEGKLFYEKAKIQWDLYNEMLDSLNKMSAIPHGKLTVGIAYGIYRYLGINFFREFEREYPEILLDVIESSDKHIDEMLTDDRVDLALSIGAYDESVLSGQLLFSRRNCLLCHKSHSLAQKDTVSVYDLENQSLITLSDSYKSPSIFRAYLEERNIHVNSVLSVSEMSFVWELCLEKQGVSLIPQGSVPFIKYMDCEQNGLVEIPLSDFTFQTDIYLLNKKDTDSFLVSLMNAYIQKKIRP